MTAVDTRQTVAQLVATHPECAQVFSRHKIDFCCRGAISVTEVAVRERLDEPALVRELEDAIAARQRDGAPARDLLGMPTPLLLAHVVDRYHAHLRTALPWIGEMSAKVSRVHGPKDPRLVPFDETFRALRAAIEPHLDEEEQVLFPLLRDASSGSPAVAEALARMIDEHLAVAAHLERLRDLREQLGLPEWACNTFRAFIAEMAHLDTELRAHIHLENHVLAPRFDVRVAATA